MPDYGAPPVIPSELQQYNSYVVDPQWQRKFTYIWVSVLGVTIIFIVLRYSSLTHFKRSLYAPRSAPNSVLSRLRSLFGIWENLGAGYQLIPSGDRKRASRVERPKVNNVKGRFSRVASKVGAGVCGLFGWSLPGIELDLGQITVVFGYMIAMILCVVLSSELVDNANRAGFLALAQLPVVFLFSSKNSLLTFLSSAFFSYDKLNFIHRWSGRGLFICALLHGALWISNHLVYDIPILGQQKETSGVAAFGVLCVLVLGSLRWVRRLWWEGFFLVHVLGYVAFFVTVCYHTIYAPPWIFPPLAFLGFDYFVRLVKYRFKDATLVPVDSNMTLIHIHDCDGGWKAGQHIRLRVFLGSRIFETHPLTISNAPPSSSCLDKPSSGRGNGAVLAARVVGDWTRAINHYASEERDRLLDLSPKEKMPAAMALELGAPLQVLIDGPYGGPSIDLGDYENVLLVAGGSGASFSVGVLDDIVGRCCVSGRKNGERTRRIEFVWYIKSYGCIQWFAPMLNQIANTVANHRAKIHAEDSTSSLTALPLDLHISIFVTCLCDPETVPHIPNSDILIERPSASKIVKSFVSPPTQDCCKDPRRDSTTTKESSPDIESAEFTSEEGGGMPLSMKGKLDWIGLEGGIGICVSGPEGLIRETGNAVSLLRLKGGEGIGNVGLHTELFAM